MSVVSDSADSIPTTEQPTISSQTENQGKTKKTDGGSEKKKPQNKKIIEGGNPFPHV